MINFANLKDIIINYIQSNNSTIIYFAIGSNYYQTASLGWDFRENQQFPPFLHDAKLKFFDTSILIILIDPSLKEEPYIVKNQGNFLDNSWITNKYHSNLFESNLGISVISISEYISWSVYNEYEQEYYNIQDLIKELAEFISQPDINSLLFYHEFTGKNTILLENIIKNKISFDSNKICIDITRGSNLSCYFNLTDPENYPVIIYENKLKYVNPDSLNIYEKIDILKQYKKFTNNFGFTSEINSNENTECLFSKYQTNYLIDKPEQMILCFQIIKSDLIMFKLLTDGIISLIRQFYTMNNKDNFGMKMYGIPYLYTIFNRSNLIDLNIIETNLKQIDSINLNKSTESRYDEKFEQFKNIILEELYNLLMLVLIEILNKYDIELVDIDNFVNCLKIHENKYDLIKIFKNYFNSKIALI
jgi:hypothetical protein